MSKYKKIGDTPIKCEICGKDVKANGMKMHIRVQHPDNAPAPESSISTIRAELADYKSQLEAAQTRVQELESVSSQVPDVDSEQPKFDRVAVLSDWMEALTPEAWLEIGKQRGFVADPPDPLPATVSDVEPTNKPEFPAPRSVYLAEIGILVKEG